MGGTAVHLTGPCFDKTDIIKCSIEDQKEIIGFVVNNHTAICVSPRFENIGWKSLILQVINSGRETYLGQSRFYAGMSVN